MASGPFLPGFAQWLLHHNPEYAADATGVRGFLGETWVHQISVMLHASGALLIAGALLAVLLMASRMHHAATAGDALEIRMRGLPWARIVLIVGWALNLLGGTMRLFEPDHPGIAEIGTVAWVQVILIKHGFILVALLASVWAVEWVPKLWRRYASHAAVVGIVFVFLAAILGGVSSGLPVPAQEGMFPARTISAPSEPPGERVEVFTNSSFSSVTAGPLNEWEQELPFRVDPWAFNLSARLEWGSSQSEFTGRLVDPNGDTAAHLEITGPTTAIGIVDVNLYPGPWVLVINSDQAIMDTVAASVKAEEGTAGERTFEGTATVTDRFLELNFWMDPGDHFHYHWSVPAAHAPVYWDIHTHPDGEVRYHEQGEAGQRQGDFVAGNEQIYSILWAPAGDRGFTIEYQITGTMRLHSVYD